MTLVKKTVPDAILFRFDPDAEKPMIRGCAYYDRTIITEDDVVVSSQENHAQPVSIAKGVPGLDLEVILNTLNAGLTCKFEEQAAELAQIKADLEIAHENHAAVQKELSEEMVAKDANVQHLLGQIERLSIIVDTFREETSAADPVMTATVEQPAEAKPAE